MAICNRVSIFATLLIGLLGSPVSPAAEPMNVTLRSRTETQPGSGVYCPRWRQETWSPDETAVIVCDMWDSHHCYNAVQRVKDMAVRMNAFLSQARDAGALIIHAPSSCTAPYADHPARQRAINAPQADNVPDGISEWCHRIDAEHEDAYPIDQSDGGEDDDPEVHRRWHEQLTAMGRNPGAPWVRQIDVLEIRDEDAITDNGVETWNLLEQHGIKNVMLVGVHTNMCVLGRPFGLRQMAQNGKHVVLVRDLTDTMYNPASWPQVAHHTGTDYIVEYIEKFVCPTVESTDLLGGKPFRFYDDNRPTIAIIVSEFEYQTYRTLPEFARRYLGKDFHVEFAINDDEADHSLPGIAILEDADVAVLSMWRRTLPQEQLAPIRALIDRGGGLVAIRTSSHAFVSRDGSAPEGHTTWPDFDRVVLGGHYRGHHGNHADRGDPPTAVWFDDGAVDHPVVSGIEQEQFQVASWLYKMQPLASDARPLLWGRVGDREPIEPIAWTRRLASGARVFYTSLGHPDDFELPQFERLLINAIHWASGQNPPREVVASPQSK